MNVLVLGASGMLGSDLCAELRSRGHVVASPTSEEFDLTSPEAVAYLAITRGAYDWCVNCAAYTAVDKAESEVRAATELNSMGPGYLAGACSLGAIKLLHISTDFVFDGEATEPYGEGAAPHPLCVYGQTKLDGELAVLTGNSNALIVRTSWLYGGNGRCFPKTIISAWEAGKTLRVVSDQYGCPTYTVDLARVLVDLIELNPLPGIYHACGPTVSTWHAFALAALRARRKATSDSRPVEVEAISTEEYPTPAKRPKNSVLATAKLFSLGIAPMRELPEALADFVERIVG